MKVRAGLLFGILLYAGAALSFSAARADDLASRVAAMYAAAASSTPAARAKLDQAYREVGEQKPDDGLADWAFSLALFQQHRSIEAVKVLSRLLQTDPQNWRARHAKIWLDLKRQSYAEVLPDLERLAATLPSEPSVAADDAALRKRREFLGHAFGYLATARAKSIDLAKLARARDAALTSLGPARSVAFLNGEAEVKSLYASALQDQERLEAEARTAAAERRENEQRRLDREKSKSVSIDKQVKQEIDSISQAQIQLAHVEARLTELQEYLAAFDLMALQLQAYRDQMQAQANTMAGKVSYRNYMSTVRGMDFQVQLGNQDLRELSRRRAGIEAAILPLEGKRQALYVAMGHLGDKIGGEMLMNEQVKRQLQLQQNRFLHKTYRTPTPSRRLLSTARGFDAYDEFPLAAEQARVWAIVQRP